MTECPKCKKKDLKKQKAWKYAHFTVQAYLCNNCGTQFRDYAKNGKHAFTLKLAKGKGFVKA